MVTRSPLLLTVFTALLLTASTAYAHPGHPEHPADARELFPGEGVVHEDQHSGNDGHLEPVSRGVNLVGKAQVSNPAGLEGRVADVAAHGNHAFLTAFRDPTCERGGAHVIDISDPANPAEIESAFMKTTEHNYAGEGAQTLRVKNEHFDGVLFIHQNETCPNAPAPDEPGTRGGIHIWDVSDATRLELLAAHAGDYTNPDGSAKDQASSTHSAFAWNNRFDGRTYAVLVDNVEFTDVDILDITDPSNPELVNDTLDLTEPPFEVEQDSPPNLTSVFNHDMVVKRVGKRYVMNVNYWDGGYVLLDVTDPSPGNVSLVAQSDYAELDEERLKRGHEISPEGNGHQSELSPDNRFLIGTDEDFNPRRVTAEITSGPYAGTEFIGANASGTPAVSPDEPLTGEPTFVGLACEPIPAGSGIALIERGTCAFQDKLDNVAAAGYDAGLVFNIDGEGCMGLVTMLAEGDIPFMFVSRLTGLQLLQVDGVDEDNACETASPDPASPAASTSIEAVFDGWGYIRLFRTKIPGKVGASGSIKQIDTFSIPEAQDPAFADGFGDLSVHEVAIDPKPWRRLAYVSYYAGGFRILRYGTHGLKEVGAFIDEGGNNFWGVEVHKIGKRQYVLASDRDFGLYIFQPKR